MLLLLQIMITLDGATKSKYAQSISSSAQSTKQALCGLRYQTSPFNKKEGANSHPYGKLCKLVTIYLSLL